MDALTELSQFYKALGDETRLRLIMLLAKQKRGNAMCVGKLARELNSTSSNISQHLRILKALGLLSSRRSGYRVHYFLDHDRLAHYQSMAAKMFKSTDESPKPPFKIKED